jgi:uncharacterized protein YjbI with pentapeptide repeats
MTYAQIIGGGILIIGAFLTWRTLRTNQETQITQRFATAIQLLGAERDDKSPKIETRIGAIYALERIAQDSQRDHWPIVEILSAYIRGRAPWIAEKEPQAERSAIKPDGDVQAALTVLSRRSREVEEGRNRHIDLRKTDLRGAELVEARLAGAHLRDANLTGADLRGADLREAVLREANLTETLLTVANLMAADLRGTVLTKAVLAWADLRGADLRGANLRGTDLAEAHLNEADLTATHLNEADLTEAHLVEARLNEADLTRAILAWAHLMGADLTGADLSTARNLTVEQVRLARISATTKLPPDVEASFKAPTTTGNDGQSAPSLPTTQTTPPTNLPGISPGAS